MKIEVIETAGIALVKPSGKLTIAGGDVALREQVAAALDAGHSRILIDLGGVTAMDSSGLGELIACKKASADRGAEIKLLDVSKKIGKVLTMTRLVGIFDIHQDQSSAVASFGSG